jgi:hypothetical protein
MVTEELENIWEDDVPALATAADTTEILVRDPAASAGNRIKDMTVTVLYNRLKTLLDTAYGAFVTRWPTYAEVTGKPEFFVDGIQTEAAANGTVRLYCDQGRIFKLTLTGNTSILFDTDTFENCNFTILITQDGSGSRTLTFDSSTATKWYNASGSAITITSTAGVTTILQGYADDATNRAYITNVSLNQGLI